LAFKVVAQVQVLANAISRLTYHVRSTEDAVGELLLVVAESAWKGLSFFYQGPAHRRD
jgi:hypothetical protein